MVICTHPVVLQARTDGDITTIFHSFFFLKIAADFCDIDVERRIPNDRVRIDDLEMGVKMTVLGTVKDLEVETFSSFVVSTSDGSRYYCAFRCFKYRVFVAVSRLPITSFTREVFDLLQMENPADLANILLILSETPVQPAASLRYTFQFSAERTVALDFSMVEQTRDHDLDMLVVKLFSPRMLVSAWEAVILEKQIMVVSKTPALVGPCCEFIRRLALPLTVVSTFIPLLHEAAVEMVESPVPYIVGVDAEILRRNTYLYFPDVIVVDLDAGVVMKQSDLAAHSVGAWAHKEHRAPGSAHGDAPATADTGTADADAGGAPPYLRERLYWDICEKMFPPAGSWLNHACCGGNYGSDTRVGAHMVHNLRLLNSRLHPQAPSNVSFNLESVLQIFMEATLSLVSARSCNVRAFFRRPESVGLSSVKDRITSQRSVSSMGFDRRDGIICGCMQLLRERKDDDMLHFLPCWVEIDGVSLVVYEYADELPLLHISANNVKSVSPSPIEPEGHVFDLEVRNQSTFRFAATGPESRRAWIEILEDLHHKAMAPKPTPAAAAAAVAAAEDCADGVGGGGDGNGGEHGHSSDESQQLALTEFRLAVMQTQMVSYIRARVECEEYFPVLHEIKPKLKNIHDAINGSVFEKCLSKYLWSGNTVSNILSNLDDDEDDPSLLQAQAPLAASTAEAGSVCSEVSSQTGHDINLLLGADGTNASPQNNSVVRVSSSSGSSSSAPENALPRSTSLGTGAISPSPVPVAAAAAAPKKSGGFFNMFKKTTSDSPSVANSAGGSGALSSADAKRMREEVREKEAEEARKADLRGLLHLVAASYRRCEAELSNGLVEDRLACLSKLVTGVTNTPYSGFQTAYSAPDAYLEFSAKNCINISIADILEQMNAAEPSVRNLEVEAAALAARGSPEDPANCALYCPQYWYVVAWRACVTLPELVESDEATAPILPPPEDAEFEVPVEPEDTSDAEIEDAVRRAWAVQLAAAYQTTPSGCPTETQQVSFGGGSSTRPGSTALDTEGTAVDSGSVVTNETAPDGSPGPDEAASEELGEEEVARRALVLEKQAERRQLRASIAKSHLDLRVKARDTHAARTLDLAKREILAHTSRNFAVLKSSGQGHLQPLLQAILGYIHYRLRDYEEALKCYCIGAIVNQKRIMYCVALKFCDEFLLSPTSSPGASHPRWETNKIKSFLQWGRSHGTTAGLQAYRLLTEIMHKRVAERLADAVLDENTGLHKKKVAISFPRVNMQSLLKKKRRAGGGREHGRSEDGTAIVEEQGLQKGLVHGALSKARGGLGVDSPEFSYATPSLDLKTDVLNEVVICVTSAIQPCELSVQLLTKLREIVRAACERLASTTELPHLKNLNASNWFHMHIVPVMLENVLTTSAYRSFELQASQLQKVDLDSLDENEKVLFFVNAYNIAYVHAIIVKGLPGKNLYERTAFMRSSKYNLGGFVFSLVELEHGILRASSSSPMLFGPFSASMAFSGKDENELSLVCFVLYHVFTLFAH